MAVRNETAHAAAAGASVTVGMESGAVARWAAENPRSAALSARARDLFPGGVTHDVRLADPFPLAVARAEGARKWDLDGHELVCYVMGHGALLLGHSHPEVVSAVRAQAGRFFHPGANHELECDWAELVIRLVPSAERVRFTSSGTEASLLALRVARAATGRDKIVKLSGHFHGWHDQVAVGSDPPFDRPDTAGLPRATADTVTVIPADAGALAEALQAGDVAAVILEPSGAAWGTVPLPEGFLAAARRLTGAAGVLLVYDEVVSGFRWAPGGVQELAAVHPDLTVLGKVLAGGMPGGAVCGRADLMDHARGSGGRPGPGGAPRHAQRPRAVGRGRCHHAWPRGAGGAPGPRGPAGRVAARRAQRRVRAGRGGRLRLRRELDVPPAVRARRAARRARRRRAEERRARPRCRPRCTARCSATGFTCSTVRAS